MAEGATRRTLRHANPNPATRSPVTSLLRQNSSAIATPSIPKLGPRAPEKIGTERLAVLNETCGNQALKLCNIEHGNLDLFTWLEALRYWKQSPGLKDIHLLVCESGRRKERAKSPNRRCLIARLLLKLARSGCGRLFAWLELSSAKLQERCAHGDPTISHKNKAPIIAHSNHCHRPRMPDDVFDKRLTRAELRRGTRVRAPRSQSSGRRIESNPLDPEHGTDVRDRNVRFGYHFPDDTCVRG